MMRYTNAEHDLEDHPIETARVAQEYSARGFLASGIARGLVLRELRIDHVAPSLSGESLWGPFRESDTALVSESRGDRFSISHPSGESDQTSKPAAAVSKLASILHPGIRFTYQAARGKRR